MRGNVSRVLLITATLAAFILISGCTLASPFDRLAAYATESAEATGAVVVVYTPRPTFTATLPATPTPTKTSTPTLTPIPTDTPTPRLPTATSTAESTDTATPAPTNTSGPPPPPPPPTNTPAPTDTPAPTWAYTLAELYNAPTQANILSIMVAIQTPDNDFIPGLRVVGVDPNGVVTKSELSAGQSVGNTPPGDVVKSGNVKFEPISNYVTGAWFFHLEAADGSQVSDTYPLTMDAENRSWFFMRFQSN